MPIRFREPLAWGAFLLLAYLGTLNFDQEMSYYRFGASGWPRAILLVLALAALALALDQTSKSPPASQDIPREQAASSGDTTRQARSALILAHFAMPVLYGVALHFAGFLLVTPIFMVIYARLLGYRSWSTLLGFTAVIILIVLLLFISVLNTPLPMGRGLMYTVNSLIISAVR